MNEKDVYIIDYLNSRNSILTTYIRAFYCINNSVSDKNNVVRQIIALINIVQNLFKKIGVEKIYINNFFNNLIRIYKKGINEVDLIVEKYDYFKILYMEYDNCIKQIKLGDLDNSYNSFMNFFLLNGFIEREDEEDVYNYFIKSALTREIKISYKAFRKVMLYYTKLEMTKLKVTPVCQIKPLSVIQSIIKRQAIKKRISIVEEEIKDLYNKGSYQVLKNIFMDLYYIENYKKACNKKIDLLAIREIKEELLSFYLPNYYEDNKDYISYELQARKYANQRLSSMFAKFNIEFKNGYSLEIENKAIEENEKEDTRIYNGKKMGLDEVFQMFSANNPKFVDEYQLLIEK